MADTELTPMVRQYMDIKKEHQDKVLFFRLGDFYEMFEDDALKVSHLLNLTLTHRGKMPMCGIPYHAAKNYLKRLLDAGLKVAICEQLQLADKAGELAKREVVQIYTPGTVVDDEYVDSFQSSFILSLNTVKNCIAASYADITTGEFYIETIPTDPRYQGVASLLTKLGVKEILISEDSYFTNNELRKVLDDAFVIVTKLPDWYFSAKEGRAQIFKQFQVNTLAGFGLTDNAITLSAIGALLRYVFEMSKSDLPQIKNIVLVNNDGYLFLDEATAKNLELEKNLQDGKSRNTLFYALDRTKSASGSRALKTAILKPLSNIDAINRRLDWVQMLLDDAAERERVRRYLSSASDIIRLSTKLMMKRSVPRDLIAIKETIGAFFSLVGEKEQYLSLLGQSLSSPDSLLTLVDQITKALNPECTNLYHEGEIILTGFDAELDGLRELEGKSSQVLSAYLETVKSETGLTILKLGENRIIGQYLEVPKGQLDKVPDYFIRRQTLVGGERFTTPRLSEIEAKIRNASSDSKECEKRLYNALVKSALDVSSDLVSIGGVLSSLDLFQSLATVASEWHYVRPHMIAEGQVAITDGRHPVVEQYLDRGAFISNSLNTEEGRFLLITGPNMAGKSTYLRASALITLMAHMGSFVSAKKAEIPLTDRIFCRVGASDNLAGGASTFLVEMQESSYILRNATNHSFVIMDEIGRGTSTQDGMSIAYAIMQYLFKIGSITLFATHYHELTMLDTTGMQLVTLAVQEDKDTVTFLRKAVQGVATSSYGLHVAKLAGIPSAVIKMAAAFQKRHFADYSFIGSNDGQLDLFLDNSVNKESDKDLILDELSDFDTDNQSPMDALLLVARLKKMIKNNVTD